MKYGLIFDEEILKHLKKIANKNDIKKVVSNILDKIECMGGDAGKLIDSKLFIYEIKMKNPPLRIYYKIINDKKEAYIFEFEMKTGKKKQQKTIDKIKDKAKDLFKTLNLYVYIF